LASSPGLSRFLDYIVRHMLSGNGDRIKEYTVGVEVFGRGSRFDPRCDAIVRVQAFNLRERLADYYRREGSTEAVTISLPKGSYRPSFQVNEEVPQPLLDDPASLCRQAERLVLQSTPEALHRARLLLQQAIARFPMVPDLQAKNGASRHSGHAVPRSPRVRGGISDSLSGHVSSRLVSRRRSDSPGAR
jgi:hypothetical protein